MPISHRSVYNHRGAEGPLRFARARATGSGLWNTVRCELGRRNPSWTTRPMADLLFSTVKRVRERKEEQEGKLAGERRGARAGRATIDRLDRQLEKFNLPSLSPPPPSFLPISFLMPKFRSQQQKTKRICQNGRDKLLKNWRPEGID